MRHKLRQRDDSEIIEEYSVMVYRMAFSLVKNRQDAEDIHQEVFLKYLRKRPAFESSEHERAWFLRVTVNLCRNLWKTAWKRKVTGDFYESLERHGESCGGRYREGCGEGYKEGQRKGYVEQGEGGCGEGLGESQGEDPYGIIELVKSLPGKYRAVIHLFYYEELSVDEISRVLGRKPSTVRTQLTRARNALKALLEKENRLRS